MFHRPVLVKETAELLVTRKDGIYLDMTCGGGGHLKFISGILDRGATLIGIDRDPDAVAAASENLKNVSQKVEIVNSSFSEVDKVMNKLGYSTIDGVLFDLGLSSHHLDTAKRGFSFMQDGPLDMRMAPNTPISAEDIVNNYSEKELARLFRELGEERQALKAARIICRERKKEKITTTGGLREILTTIFPARFLNASLARIFQAIRIEVNGELDQLRRALPLCLDMLQEGGRMVVIAYHSLEDRIVKRFMAENARGCICPANIPVCVCEHTPSIKLLNKRVIKPSIQEVEANSRARSARLRAAEKIK